MQRGQEMNPGCPAGYQQGQDWDRYHFSRRLSDFTFTIQAQFWLDSSILPNAKSRKLLQFNDKR